MTIADVYRPKTLEDALALKAEHGEALRALAGGTDVISGVRAGTLRADALLDLGLVDELAEIEELSDEVRIGSGVTHARVAESGAVRARLAILAEASASVGSAQIRNRGTIGGNVVNASPAADSVPPLWVLGATCELRSAAGRREVPIETFFTGPGLTVLGPDELLTGVRVRKAPSNARWFYRKLGQRLAMVIAKVSVAFLAVPEGHVLRDVRIALGAVAPTVVGAPETARLLEGRRLDDRTVREAARRVTSEVQPISDVRSTAEYRREMAGVLLARGLRSCLE